jgi:hypothetical protein
VQRAPTMTAAINAAPSAVGVRRERLLRDIACLSEERAGI